MTDHGESKEITATGPTTTPTSVRELVIVWSAAFSMATLYVLDAAAHGALGAARNDDWVYYRMAFDFAETGRLRFDPYTSTMLVGQIVAAKPVIWLFGPSIAALQLCVAVIGAVAMALMYLFIRRFLPPLWSAFSVACVALGPIWGGVSVTFLSDAPALALQVLCLFTALPALTGAKIRWPWLIASLAVGLAGFSFREYAIAAVASVLLVALLKHRKSGGSVTLLLAAGAVWLGIAIAMFAWRSSLVDGERALRPRLELDQRIGILALGLLTTAGFMLFPAAATLVPMSIGRLLRRYWLITAFFVLFFTYTSSVLNIPLLVGNYIRLGGSYSGTISGLAPRVFSEEVWWGMMLLANVATSLLLTFVIAMAVQRVQSRRRRRAVATDRPWSPDRTAFLLAAAFSSIGLFLTIVVSIVSGGRPFDRYLVGIIPFAAAAAIYLARGRAVTNTSKFVGAAVLATMALIGIVQVDASATYDGTKWSLGTEGERLGYAASTIDAGYEWYGFHQPTDVVYQRTKDKNFPFWVTQLFVDGKVCLSGRVAPRPNTTTPYAGEVLRVSRTTITGLKYIMIASAADRGCPRD